MQAPTPEMIEEWKDLWRKYKDYLKPDRKSGWELLDYLSQKYTLTEIYDKKAAEAVRLNVTMNKPAAEKLPAGAPPQPRTFYIEREGGGCALYENMAEGFKDGMKIFLGIDMASGFYMVEGAACSGTSCALFRGWIRPIYEITIVSPNTSPALKSSED